MTLFFVGAIKLPFYGVSFRKFPGLSRCCHCDYLRLLFHHCSHNAKNSFFFCSQLVSNFEFEEKFSVKNGYGDLLIWFNFTVTSTIGDSFLERSIMVKKKRSNWFVFAQFDWGVNFKSLEITFSFKYLALGTYTILRAVLFEYHLSLRDWSNVIALSII